VTQQDVLERCEIIFERATKIYSNINPLFIKVLSVPKKLRKPSKAVEKYKKLYILKHNPRIRHLITYYNLCVHLAVLNKVLNFERFSAHTYTQTHTHIVTQNMAT
jgi:hypothetical protein